MTDEDLQREIEKLREENLKLKESKNKSNDIYFRVSQKGAVSVYGMGKYPVTLYKQQWEKLLGKKDELMEFIIENEEDLKVK